LAIWSIAAAVVLSPVLAFLIDRPRGLIWSREGCRRARTPCACGSGRCRLVSTSCALAACRG